MIFKGAEFSIKVRNGMNDGFFSRYLAMRSWFM